MDLTIKVNVKENDTTSALSAMKKMIADPENTIPGIIVGSQNLAQAVEHISNGSQNASLVEENASASKEMGSVSLLQKPPMASSHEHHMVI